jgi:hypothetical protein
MPSIHSRQSSSNQPNKTKLLTCTLSHPAMNRARQLRAKRNELRLLPAKTFNYLISLRAQQKQMKISSPPHRTEKCFSILF